MAMEAITDTKAMLRRAKLRCTRGRAAILEVLLKAGRPLTQEEITRRLGREHLDKVTIYRALECFEQAGLVHRAFMQDRTWHFELSHHCSKVQCHPHFFCTQCETTKCLLGITVPLANGLGEGFVIQRQQVRLDGVCPQCSRARRGGQSV